MARFYADEQFPRRIVEVLQSLGHDVLTVQAAANRGLPDDAVLAFATQANRAVLTFNRRHFDFTTNNPSTLALLSVKMIPTESALP